MYKSYLKKLVLETYNSLDDIYYHGTRTTFPFSKFDERLDGSGIVSSGNKFGGFFFTSNKENAEYYTEWFVATVKINNIEPNPLPQTHSPTVLKQAIKDNKNYKINDVLDGSSYSDIVVVPHQNLNDITIIKWEFVGDEESYFETLDNFFGHEDINDINKENILSILKMINVDPNYIMKIPIFKKYFDLK